MRWTSGLLPSDLHPSPEAPCSAPLPPSVPPTPYTEVATGAALQLQHRSPSPAARQSPVPALQPAAVTLYQVCAAARARTGCLRAVGELVGHCGQRKLTR